MFNPRFNYLVGDIRKATVQGSVSLANFLNRVREPQPKMVDLINKIRNANDKEKDFLKTKLPSVTPCVYFNKGTTRKYSNIVKFTGIMMLDFDKIKDASIFRDLLFVQYPYLFAAWLSSSGKGVRAMVRIPECSTTDEFKERFEAVKNEMKHYMGFDSAPKNCVLPLFYSIDPDIKFRLVNVPIFEGRTKIHTPEPKPITWIKPDSKKGKWAINNTVKAIDKITDNGHPQLRAASYALGGYVGAGYLSEFEAVDLIEQLIRGNSYLSIKPDVYIQTAKTMIRKGANEPLML